MSEEDVQGLLSQYQITFSDRVEIVPNKVAIQLFLEQTIDIIPDL